MAPWPEPWRLSDTRPEPEVEPELSAGRGIRDFLAANCTSLLGVPASARPAEAGADPGSKQQPGPAAGRDLSLDEFQIIKAVVLGLVTSIILLSICKMVFQLFVRYAAKADDR